MNKTTLIIIGALAVAIVLIFVGARLGSGISAPAGGHGAALRTFESDDNKAPDFTLETIDGEKITLSDYQGARPVVLDFFATWCPNCQRDMPRLSGLYEKYKDDVEVIGVNLQESPAKVRSFRDSRNIAFPIVLDPAQQATRKYGVRYTNFHVLIDTEGKIVGTVPGDISESHILSLINS